MFKKQLKLSFLLLTICFLNIAMAQKFCYVDIDYILTSIPEYQQAQHELDVFSKRWEQEINRLQLEIDEMYRVYYAEEVLYTEDIKAKKLLEIKTKEEALEQYTQEKFGHNGALFIKRQELIKPIQDNIYEAVEKLASDKRYDFVLDKSAGLTILYADPDYDKSNLVLKYLGY